MSTAENVKVAQASFDALNAHDLDKWQRLNAPNITFEGPGAPGPLKGEQNRAYIQGFLTAFPDLHFNILKTMADGDHVVMEWTGTGTHKGPLVAPSGNSTPPTGKKATVRGSSTFEIMNGKVTASRTYWDMVELLGQLGLMPPM
jgi:steroid delta-isomerase-like uncharacterized protein